MKIFLRSCLNKIVDKIFFNNEKYLKVYYSNGIQNFGDVVTPLLIEKLSSKKVRHIPKPKYFHNPHILAIGSILHLASKDSIIWGAGFMDAEKKCYQVPKKIYTVRGKKTRERLLKQGIECPEIYGDPALLLPLIYSPKIEKKYKLGIIPHYTDKKNEWLQQFIISDSVKIIDVQNPNVLKFINELLSCEKIASSSLHGIITADAYGIASTWIEFGNIVDRFKFLDYFSSVGRSDTEPLQIVSSTSLPEIFSMFYDYKIKIDLQKIIMNAPFKIETKFKRGSYQESF